jgi:type I restriction enzyme, R subunit
MSRDAFKDPEHPFRVAIVCAMWLTGFDVECLSTLYIDKPMKAHTLMQAIARANRVYPGKDCGVIVDYNGMLRSLRQALAQYALGDEEGSGEGRDRRADRRASCRR